MFLYDNFVLVNPKVEKWGKGGFAVSASRFRMGE